MYKINKDGTGYEKLYDFVGGTSSGSAPEGELLLDNGVFYGTTYSGGADASGTIFKINKDGTGYETLFHFQGNSDGRFPSTSLITDGTYLYGSCEYGGASGIPNDLGTLFKIQKDGTGFEKLVTFKGNSNGEIPSGTLVYDGTYLYGTTKEGGNPDEGTIFRLKTDGSDFTTLKQFTGDQGAFPYAELHPHGDYFYGTTAYGGTDNSGTVYQIKKDGSDFKVIHSFAGTDNQGLIGGVIFKDSFLYGTTNELGANSKGSVFKLSIIDCSPSFHTQSVSINQGDSIVIGNTTYKSPGTYIDTLKNLKGCDSILTTNLSFSSSILSIFSNDIVIYPNPVKDYLYFENINGQEGYIEIYNIDGSLILKSYLLKGDDNAVDVSFMPKGLYIMKLYNSETVSSYKLIKD